MNNSKEHEDINADQTLDKSVEQANITPAKDESALSDLLHVLGIKKKTSAAQNLHHASHTPTIVPVSTVLLDKLVTQVPPNLAVLENLNDADLISEEAFDRTNENNLTNTAVVLTDILTPTRQKQHMRIITLFTVALLIASVVVYFTLPYLSEPLPPGEDVVASYNGKNVLIEELKNLIALEQAKEYEHAYCELHGQDHTKCTSDEECESHPIDSLEGYQQMVTRLVVEQIIQEWASTQGITQREDVQHGIKDLLDDASVSQLMERIHEEEITPESISSWDVQQYYDDNRESYGGKSFAEVEDEIRQILVSQKDKYFLTEYIDKLKQTAGLKVNFDILRMNEPTDNEISAYYSQNASEYQVPKKAEALEIRITTGDTQNKAMEAIRKIRSGESFDSVAKAYDQEGKASHVLIDEKSSEAATEAAIWKMQPGDISEPLPNTDGSASIIKLVSITQAGMRSLAEVKLDIRSIIVQKNMEKEYSLRKDEALFSVHSRRYTLGDFYTEYKELSAEYQAQFSTFDQKKQLVEQLIAKELLLEETGDNSSDEKGQHRYDELKIQYLSQILHQQEVDEKLTDPTEDEIKKFYIKNRKSYVSPASAQISLIWIDQGPNGEKTEQAKQKANEALSQLRGGTEFAEVAKQYSEDASAISGGVLDSVIYRNHVSDQLGTAIFALASGETSDIIEFDYGYYIVLMRERTEERQMAYEESIESIKALLRDEKHHQLESNMEKVLLENANFTVYARTLRRLLKEQINQ